MREADRHAIVAEHTVYILFLPPVCESPPVIANGGPDVLEIPELMDVGKNITYKCRPGFSFRADRSTERVVECLRGAYYSAIENCQR